jgi:outer membrane protein assembly factor BamB
VSEKSKPSRRSYLAAVSTACVGSVGGCLRLAESGSDPATDTDATGDGRTTSTSPTASAGGSAIREAWTLSKWGSDVVPFDGTFYASTWVSKQVYALDPDGTVRWKTDEVGKFKRDSLAVTDSLVVGCAYGGQVTAFDRETGDVRWNFTGGTYDQWSSEPLVTDRYVVAANLADNAEEDRAVVYVLDRDTGEVVDTAEYPNLVSPISSLGTVDGRLYVTTWNYLDLYDLDSLSRSATYEEGLFGDCRVHDGDLFAAVDDNVYRYALDGSELTNEWGVSLRGQVSNLTVTDDGIVANGQAGLFGVGLDGSKRWWAQTDGAAGRGVRAGEAVVAMDEFLQLYAIDAGGERTGKVELPSKGSMSPISSIGSVVLTAVEPFTAFEVG